MVHFICDTPAFLFVREELKGFLLKVKGVPDHVNLFPCVIDVLGYHTGIVVPDAATNLQLHSEQKDRFAFIFIGNLC